MTEKKYQRYYQLAGRASFENWDTIFKNKICGCYYCGSIFTPSAIDKDEDWTQDENGKTVLCPYCGIDSVIGDNSGIPINKEVLDELYDKLFSDGKGEEEQN